MDSFVVDPADVRMQFAIMQVERMDALEDKVTALCAANAALKAEVEVLKQAVEAQPKPIGYWVWLAVPLSTTRQQAEDGLRAAWADQKLSAGGALFGFCVSMDSPSVVKVFVFGAGALMPHHVLAWLQAAVPGSRLHGTRACSKGMRAILYSAEELYFMWHLRGLDTWAIWPSVGDWWIKRPMADVCGMNEACAEEVEAWMETTHKYEVPYVLPGNDEDSSSSSSSADDFESDERDCGAV